ncbi:MAG TPA: hypothetical protein VFG34_09405 [Sphingopyxis sp.]|nr:hypothetical protein [Sphingopyxis sp.]
MIEGVWYFPGNKKSLPPILFIGRIMFGGFAPKAGYGIIIWVDYPPRTAAYAAILKYQAFASRKIVRSQETPAPCKRNFFSEKDFIAAHPCRQFFSSAAIVAASKRAFSGFF